MRLTEWMGIAGLSYEDLGQMAGVPKPTAYSWAAQGKISGEAIARIQAITNGRVTAADFYPSQLSYGETTEAKAAQARVFRALI
jgi:transcriptional regulator with XRE-family HTH domain